MGEPMWEKAARNFPEVPKGMNPWKVYSNAGVYPLYATIGLAALFCTGYMARLWGGHPDVNWSKEVRADANAYGTDRRTNIWNSRFGFREMNKHRLNIWPFNWVPMKGMPSPPPRKSPTRAHASSTLAITHTPCLTPRRDRRQAQVRRRHRVSLLRAGVYSSSSTGGLSRHAMVSSCGEAGTVACGPWATL